jgi:hypothetical protein
MFSKPKRTLVDACADFVTAVHDRDERALQKAIKAVAGVVERTEQAELDAAAQVVAHSLGAVSLGDGVPLAKLSAGLVEAGADPTTALDAAASQVVAGLDRASAFPAMWREIGGGDDLPDPEHGDKIPTVLARLATAANEHGYNPDNARDLASAWFSVNEWIPALLLPLQDRRGRAALPGRDRLTAAAHAAPKQIDAAHWLYGLLQVLDDEQLCVIHRESGRGYKVTIGGIGDNFQLHTLLAATLIGDPAQGFIAGTPPRPAWIAAATNGEIMPNGGVRGQFNLVDAFGDWIWNEGRPIDIPLMDGRRVVVIDPPPYDRGWNAGRVYPLMPPSIRLDGVMSAQEAAYWAGSVAPDGRG